MERLKIDEIIEHCKRQRDRYEQLNGINTLENSDISHTFIKEYWEHRQVAEYLEELKKYRDTNLAPEQMLEIDKAFIEQAKELEELKKQLPPCKVGDSVYWVNNHYRTYGDYKIDEEKVGRLIFDGEDWIIDMGAPKDGAFGKTVFLTKAEAEAKLKEMEGE